MQNTNVKTYKNNVTTTINPFASEEATEQALATEFQKGTEKPSRFEMLPDEVKNFLEEVFDSATHEREVVYAIDTKFEGKTVTLESKKDKGFTFDHKGYSKIADYAVAEFKARQVTVQ